MLILITAVGSHVGLWAEEEYGFSGLLVSISFH